jgi:hypothetical protein
MTKINSSIDKPVFTCNYLRTMKKNSAGVKESQENHRAVMWMRIPPALKLLRVRIRIQIFFLYISFFNWKLRSI